MEVFEAIAQFKRREILRLLAAEELSAGEVASRFAVTQPAISRHLKVLETAGLIVRRIEGSKRPCRLAPEAIKDIDRWLGMLRDALAKNYDRLDAVLASMKTQE